MMYTVKRIDEDLDFGCEERPEDVPVMALVTLVNSSGKEVTVKAEDAELYERNIKKGDKVWLDVNNKLEKAESYREKVNGKANCKRRFLFRPTIRTGHESRYPSWKRPAGYAAGEPGALCGYGGKHDWCKEEYHHCKYGLHRCCDVQSGDRFKA